MKFLAIGDSCTDKFIYGKCDRICPEAPVPVFTPVKEKTNGGMAANVKANVEALGIKCDLITQSNEIVKTRYVDIKTNQMLLRIDENDEAEDKFNYKDVLWDRYDAVLVSNRDICQYHDNVYLDSNKVHMNCDLPLNLKFLKINEYELEINSHWKHHLTPSQHGSSEYNRPAQIIVTLGYRGCQYMGKIYPPSKKVVAQDVSVAGDTFLSALAVSMTRVGDAEVAIEYANECAVKVVQKRGVCTI